MRDHGLEDYFRHKTTSGYNSINMFSAIELFPVAGRTRSVISSIIPYRMIQIELETIYNEVKLNSGRNLYTVLSTNQFPIISKNQNLCFSLLFIIVDIIDENWEHQIHLNKGLNWRSFNAGHRFYKHFRATDFMFQRRFCFRSGWEPSSFAVIQLAGQGDPEVLPENEFKGINISNASAKEKPTNL